MHKRLLVGLLGAVLTLASVFPFTKSDAAHSSQPKHAATSVPVTIKRATLPNFDLRLAGKGEFNDVDLSSTAPGKGSALQRADTALQARSSAVDNFRARLNPEAAQNLHATVNESGAMKNFFIDGAPLSEAQSDTPDNIARNFLRPQASLFALSESAVNALKLNKEDNDRGTTFLDYSQTIGGHQGV